VVPSFVKIDALHSAWGDEVGGGSLDFFFSPLFPSLDSRIALRCSSERMGDLDAPPRFQNPPAPSPLSALFISFVV